MSQNIKILVVDDDEDDFVIVKDLLNDISKERFTVSWEPDYYNAKETIINQAYDIYLVDYRLGSKNGLDLLTDAVNINRRIPVIMLTGQGETDVDMKAMEIGAADFLTKDKIDAMSLERSIRYALSNAQAIHKLYEQEKKYRTLFEQSLSSIFITDEQFHVVDMNQSMFELFGYSRKEVIGSAINFLFVSEDDYKNVKTQLESLGQIKDLEVELSTKNGKVKLSNISITQFLDSDGSVKGHQAIIEDISEKKIIQQELIQLEKLIMTGNIARTIAHEVRNPLTNINLALEQFSFGEEDTETLDLYVDIIRRNTKRINQLISEMLRSSKPSDLQLKHCKLNHVLEKALELAKDRIKLRDIKLVKLFEKDLPDLPVDEEKLALAILNIINNALEAVEPQKGVLSLKTKHAGNLQVITICDNGIGISTDEIKSLFDAFHTGKKGGMGLGLTFTQNIINSHRAKIAVDSTLGKGTCFKISFENKLS